MGIFGDRSIHQQEYPPSGMKEGVRKNRTMFSVQYSKKIIVENTKDKSG